MYLRIALTRRSTSRALIFSLACVLLSAFSLKRAVERTPIDKETAGFKFSKTLELPHKKVGLIPVAAIRTERVTLDAEISECSLPLRVVHLCHGIDGRQTSPRAPPVALSL